MRGAAPLRFLALVAILWIGARALVLAPGWWVERGEASPIESAQASAAVTSTTTTTNANATTTTAAAATTVAPPTPVALSELRQIREGHSLIREFPYKGTSPSLALPRPVPLAGGLREPEFQFPLAPAAGGLSQPVFQSPPALPAGGSTPLAAAALPADGMSAQTPPRPQPRWSASAWLLARRDQGGGGLAPGGTLGGSQAGGRLLYRADEGLALSARAYLPLRRSRGAEAAVGVDWRPAPGVPVHLLIERRQDLGGEGRSAFAVSAYGGTSAPLPGGLRLDAYAQAGVVGTRSRDLFVDGSVRVSAPVGPVEVGAGAWGGAQPGATRLDAGPQVSWRLPVEGANLRIEANWRFRIAGDAAPGSGPALTLAADF